MKNSTLSIVLLLIGLYCHISTAQQATPTDEATYYVIAPNGLSIRTSSDLTSERIAVMPLGSEVRLLEKRTNNNVEVEHINGGMDKVAFNNLSGYCFNGYLSTIAPPKERYVSDTYLKTLAENHSEATYESKPNPDDFHQGHTDTAILPVRTWHEAFYLVSAIYDIPKTLGFPNPVGPKKETIEDSEKDEDVWTSALYIERGENSFLNISYGFRSEGYGRNISITPNENGFFKVKAVQFVD